MATKRKTAAKQAAKKTSSQTVTRVERMEPQKDESVFERLSSSFQKNQSFFNIVLGGLIVVVLAVLLFNYFNQPTEELAGPGVQNEQAQTPDGDVAKDKLPGKYTVKEGDTLFSIAQNYYDDGYKYPELVTANSLSNENAIAAGQEITIPKLDDDGQATAMASQSPSASPEASEVAEATLAPQATAMAQATPAPVASGGTGGAENVTVWGEKITSDTYTVQAGDWLSKIAGRAYGDVYAYNRIAQANNIANPDAIEVGMTLKIPR